VVIAHILLKEPLEVAFAQYDNMIQALAANTADEALHVGILPRRTRSDDHLVNPHVPDALLKDRAIDAVPIASQMLRSSLPGKRLNDLLCSPLRRGVFRNVEMYDAPALMGENCQDEEHLVGDGRHDKKVECDYGLHMNLSHY
jgi:hypothetical protein